MIEIVGLLVTCEKCLVSIVDKILFYIEMPEQATRFEICLENQRCVMTVFITYEMTDATRVNSEQFKHTKIAYRLGI